jgi:hypothetical protein
MGFEQGDNIILRNCGHIFHEECVHDYVLAALKDMKTKIPCPDAECGVELHQVDIRDSVSTVEFNKYEMRMIDSLVHTDNTLQRCPTPDCAFIFDPIG